MIVQLNDDGELSFAQKKHTIPLGYVITQYVVLLDLIYNYLSMKYNFHFILYIPNVAIQCELVPAGRTSTMRTYYTADQATDAFTASNYDNIFDCYRL